jgi:hypothetical protein
MVMFLWPQWGDFVNASQPDCRRIAGAGYDSMYEDEEDEKLDIKLNPDSWLEQHGWAKIHDNNINFIGSNALSLYHKPVVYLTPIQIKKIYEYGQICCDGKLLMGWRREFISAHAESWMRRPRQYIISISKSGLLLYLSSL